MEKLQQIKKEQKAHFSELGNEQSIERPAELLSYQKFLEGLNRLSQDPSAQRQRAEIVQKLVHRVEIKPDTYRIYFLIGKNYVSQAGNSGGKDFFTYPGSNTLTNGWETRIRT